MNDLIRTDTVFDKRVNIVGNISADLVLESLGKIYIKSRNKSLTLEEVIKSLAGEDPNISTSRTKVVNGIEGLDTTEFKEGTFIFDKLSNILYLFIDNELLELINVTPGSTSYVKRSGDTMTGRLAIYVKNGPPLYVNSSTLVENLNAQYLNGETGESFTKRNKDEKVNGAWTFRKPITFESPVSFYKDIITHGSIGAPEFLSGFGGYGWRMDADTNTLTIDNLVVRKLMLVYELVVNKISATNGSLWITNAGKVTSVLKLEIKSNSFFSNTYDLGAYRSDYEEFCSSLHLNDLFIRLFDEISYKIFSDPIAAFSTASGDGIFIKQCWDNTVLKNAKLIKYVSASKYVGYEFDDADASDYKMYNLFNSDFNFDCTFPIVTRNNYTRYLQEKEYGNVDISSYVSNIYSYFKYFAGGDYYIVTFDDDNLPVFKPGDILRCLKWTNGGIKYYDAVVCNIISKSYVILLAKSILDKKTTITYDSSFDSQISYMKDEVNLDLYKQSSHYKEPSEDPNENINHNEDGSIIRLSYLNQLEKDLLGVVEEKDSLVLIGNLWDPQRLNAVYITSTDNGAPFMDVMSGVNRPDYSVIYYIPIYLTIKLNATVPVNKNAFHGFTGLTDIPYTGNYYILKNRTNCEYVYFKYNNAYYLAIGSTVPSIPGDSVDVLYYLNTIPNENTAFGSSSEFFFFLTESGEKITTEGFENGEIVEEEYIVLEEEHHLLLIASTRTTKVRLGNLDGILDEIFPIDRLPYGYGLYGLNVFLTGEFYLNNGRSLADIGNDAITFAIAALNSFYNSLNILKEDLQRSDNLMSLSVYSKGELRSAGMRIGNDAGGNPGILLWGNHIIIATTLDEFNGNVPPTALFADGKIQAKFLSIEQARCQVATIVGQTLFTITTPALSSTDSPISITYTSSDPTAGTPALLGTVRIYRVKNLINTYNGQYYFSETRNVYYVRRFLRSSDNQYIWLRVNPDGYPINKDSSGQYVLSPVSFTWYRVPDNPNETFNDGIFPLEAEDAFVNLYTEPLRVWGLEVDGKGNLGGSTLYWNLLGKVVINGILYSTEGKIGGLTIGENSIFTRNSTYNYNSLTISTTGYGYVENDNNLPYILLQSHDSSGTIRHRSVMTSRGVFLLINTNPNLTNPTWRLFATISTPGILFSLTIIPVKSTVGSKNTTLYARHFCNLVALSTIYVCWDKGKYALHFTYMNNLADNAPFLHETNWFIEQLIKGNISFQITGHNKAYCHENYDTGISVRYSNKFLDYESGIKKYYMFNLEYVLDNPDIRFKMYDAESDSDYDDAQDAQEIRASVDLIAFRGTKYHFNDKDLTGTSLEGYRANFSRAFTYGSKIDSIKDNSIHGKYDSGGIYSWGKSNLIFSDNEFTNNVILVTAGTSVNWGGFTLTCLYHPALDNRFVADNNHGLDTGVARLRLELEAYYGDNDTPSDTSDDGIRVSELRSSLKAKTDAMSALQLSDQASTISNINSNIEDLTITVNNINSSVSYNELFTILLLLDNSYLNILNTINNLQAG